MFWFVVVVEKTLGFFVLFNCASATPPRCAGRPPRARPAGRPGRWLVWPGAGGRTAPGATAAAASFVLHWRRIPLFPRVPHNPSDGEPPLSFLVKLHIGFFFLFYFYFILYTKHEIEQVKCGIYIYIYIYIYLRGRPSRPTDAEPPFLFW